MWCLLWVVELVQVVGSVSSDYQRVHLDAHISECDRMRMGAESQMMNASMLPAQGDRGGGGGWTMMGYAGQEMCGGGLNGRHPEMLVHQAQAAREAAMRSQVHHHSSAHTHMLERESTEDEAAEAGRSLHATWETMPAQRRPCPSWGGGQRDAMSVDARLACGGVSWGGGYRAQEAIMGIGGSERLGVSPYLGTGAHTAYESAAHGGASSILHAGYPAGHPEPFTMWLECGFPALDRDAGGMQGVAAAQDVMHGNAHVKRENYDGSDSYYVSHGTDSYNVSHGTDSYNVSHPANKRPKSEGTSGRE